MWVRKSFHIHTICDSEVHTLHTYCFHMQLWFFYHLVTDTTLELILLSSSLWHSYWQRTEGCWKRATIKRRNLFWNATDNRTFTYSHLSFHKVKFANLRTIIIRFAGVANRFRKRIYFISPCNKDLKTVYIYLRNDVCLFCTICAINWHPFYFCI